MILKILKFCLKKMWMHSFNFPTSSPYDLGIGYAEWPQRLASAVSAAMVMRAVTMLSMLLACAPASQIYSPPHHHPPSLLVARGLLCEWLLSYLYQWWCERLRCFRYVWRTPPLPKLIPTSSPHEQNGIG